MSSEGYFEATISRGGNLLINITHIPCSFVTPKALFLNIVQRNFYVPACFG
jgi:hypothetical protein